jgi:hypothetical protein
VHGPILARPSEPGDGAAVQLGDQVGGGVPGRSGVLEGPAEQAGVERLRRLTSTPRPARWSRAASASATTACRLSSDPGAIPVNPLPNAIEHADPGGVICTKRISSLTAWS